jgi:hypothetical protein
MHGWPARHSLLLRQSWKVPLGQVAWQVAVTVAPAAPMGLKQQTPASQSAASSQCSDAPCVHVEPVWSHVPADPVRV